MKKLYVKTYGCEMNIYDSQKMTALLGPWGYQISAHPEDADMVIINTCYIREKASEKLYSDLGRIKKMKDNRLKNGDDTVIVVAGCVAQAHGTEIYKQAPFVDLVVGPQSYHQLPILLSQAQRKKEEQKLFSSKKPGLGIIATDFPLESKFDYFPETTEIKGPTGLVTIQEGCDRYCHYCVVPYTRGAEYSRPVEDILKEVNQLVKAGVKEIVLLGQNVNAYHGSKGNKTWGLAELIEALEQIEQLERVRYTTSHPTDMTDDLIAMHGKSKKLLLLLHLPIQSGSDKVLKLMNRQHTVEEYRTIVHKLQEANALLRLSTDIIIGHPGETQEDFEQTLQVYQEIGYTQSYSFKFSPRPGTPAAIREDQVCESIKEERLFIFQEMANHQHKQFNQQSIGQIVPVFYDRKGHQSHQLIGKTLYGQSVHIEGNERLCGHTIPTLILNATASSLTGEIVTKEYPTFLIPEEEHLRRTE